MVFLKINGTLDNILYLNCIIIAIKIWLFRVENVYLAQIKKSYIFYKSVKHLCKKKKYYYLKLHDSQEISHLRILHLGKAASPEPQRSSLMK